MNAPKSARVFLAIVAGLSMTLATQAVAQTPAPTPKDKLIPINIAMPLSGLWPAHPSVGCKLVKVQALALQVGRKDPEQAVRALQEVLTITNKHAREIYETLYIPSIESQLNPKFTI